MKVVVSLDLAEFDELIHGSSHLGHVTRYLHKSRLRELLSILKTLFQLADQPVYPYYFLVGKMVF